MLKLVEMLNFSTVDEFQILKKKTKKDSLVQYHAHWYYVKIKRKNKIHFPLKVGRDVECLCSDEFEIRKKKTKKDSLVQNRAH